MSKKSRTSATSKTASPKKFKHDQASSATNWSGKKHGLIAGSVLVFLVSLLIYSNNWNHDFVYDDENVIKTNTRIRSLNQVRSLFTTPYWGSFGNDGLYRPITLLSFALNYHFSQLSSRSYHVVNDFLHGFNSILIFLLTSQLLQSIPIGLCAALLFALHPVHTEAVNWVVGRAELLAALLVLISIFLSIYPSPLKSQIHWKRTILVVMASFLGILCKENAVISIVLITFLLFLINKPAKVSLRQLGTFVKDQKWLFAGWVILMCLWFAIRAHAVGENIKPTAYVDNQLVSASRAQKTWTALSLFSLWLKKLFLPFSFSVDYGPPKLPTLSSPWHIEVLVAVLILLCLMLVSFRFLRRQPWISFWTVFFLVAYLPTSNLFLTIGTIFGERFLYLPSVAFCVLVGYGLCQLPRRWITAVLLGLISLVYGTYTLRRNGDWKDNSTLFGYELQHRPCSARTLRNVAKLLESSDPAGAIQIYQEVIQSFPDYAAAPLGLGSFYLEQGEYEKAIEQLSKANSLEPNNPTTLLNLGAAYAGQRQWNQAVRCWETVLSIDPANQMAQINLSQIKQVLKPPSPSP